MIFGRGQGREGNREPACCQIMVIMVSILMMIIKLMTMTVMTVPLATCKLLLASCNLVITLRPVLLATCYLPLLLRTSILLGQLIDTKSDHPPSRIARKLRSATDNEPPSPQAPTLAHEQAG